MADDNFLEGILNEDGIAIWSQHPSQLSSQSEDHASPIKDDSPSLKFSKRSKKISKEEDNMLVSAYLEISLDPVQGSDQSGKTYWSRMHHFFHTHKTFESDHGEKSLSSRLQVIFKDTTLFKGYYEKIQKRNQSGISESDKIVQALAMYTSEEKRLFGFLHCWNTLKHQQKWIDRPNIITKKKEKIDMSTSSKCQDAAEGSAPGGSAPDEESMGSARPPGRKGEKERQRRGKNSSSERDNHYMEAMNALWAKRKESDDLREISKKERHEEKVKVQLGQLEDNKINTAIRKWEMEEKIMSKDTSAMSETQRLYYESLQKEIVARRLEGGLP